CSRGEEKAPGRAQSPWQGLKGLQESWRGTGDKGWRDRSQGMAPSARGQGWVGDWELGIPGWAGIARAAGANSWAQAIRRAQPPRQLGLQARATAPGAHSRLR
uniref:Uncharacterized protein n=1 Tax=Serinus canaria TaxID=9135 RepID=A0A8C9KUB4_SERCA